MKWHRRTSHGTRLTKAPGNRRVAKWVALVSLLAIALFGRGIAGWRVRQVASRRLATGAVGAAERWLTWAEWLDSRDSRSALMRATCFRHLRQRDAWNRAIQSAEQMGAPRDEVRCEVELGKFGWGEIERISPTQFESLLEVGASPRDAVTAIVHGLLEMGELTQGMQFIESWTSDPADEPQASYLRGMCYWSVEQRKEAQAEFEKALASQPQHDMARASLGRLLEQQDLLREAFEHYAQLAMFSPERESVKVDLARVLRKMGRIEDARRVLRPPASSDDVTQFVAIELAEREYEAGNYDEASRWFKRANIDGAHVAETLRAAASTFALRGDPFAGRQLFDRVDKAQSFSRHLSELQRRLSIDPGDQVADEELQNLMGQASATGPQRAIDAPMAGNASELFLKYCAACHGTTGDGAGRAARHLFPRPSNLRNGRFRLVSTLNGVATLTDIEGVIERGIPGTAMPSFSKLPGDHKRLLALEVQRLYRSGIRERNLELSKQGATADEDDESKQEIDALATPGEVLAVPPIPSVTAESIARGRKLYSDVGCHHCHGVDGASVVELPLFDDGGQPAVPRSLVRDLMKGGAHPESLYRRIRLGMPGTPHPAAPSLDEEELISLVHFSLSLSQEPKKVLTNYQRSLRATRRASPF